MCTGLLFFFVNKSYSKLAFAVSIFYIVVSFFMYNAHVLILRLFWLYSGNFIGIIAENKFSDDRLEFTVATFLSAEFYAIIFVLLFAIIGKMKKSAQETEVDKKTLQ